MFGFFQRKIAVKVACECKSKESTLQKIASIAQSLTFVVALVTVSVTYFQIKASSEQAQQQLASTMYQSYLQSAFDYPKFAEPIALASLCVEETEKSKCETRYEWFAARVLYTAENILELDLSEGDMQSWKHTVDRMVENHSEYIRSDAFQEHASTYSCELLEILAKYNVLNNCGS
ncbi:hypothetical protein CGG88_23515 [Vibrio parahaemolyticus]|uniref:hypothetical protein n=1 Tax=Vibrio parahaemolyticus TaxID=670 RepID=UPI00111FD50C|nr:hypothetical protein [Vibrio parahaemolyticus]EGQ8102515.1 hypothetical protein [Vibrio parahaemolyticus]EGQ9289832.1 hypothetical protein [Vibrio parahaemolyticus]EID4382652.1 hypothetical protein [Vibrio parahaemolyticus]TOQ76159.1 hypothetical protein CGG88_23515 [Vibrio parahaemolyticus]